MVQSDCELDPCPVISGVGGSFDGQSDWELDPGSTASGVSVSVDERDSRPGPERSDDESQPCSGASWAERVLRAAGDSGSPTELPCRELSPAPQISGWDSSSDDAARGTRSCWVGGWVVSIGSTAGEGISKGDTLSAR